MRTSSTATGPACTPSVRLEPLNTPRSEIAGERGGGSAAHALGDVPRRRRCEAEKTARNCGFEFNTTIVYHNKRSHLVHAHVTREAGGHEAPQPALKCGQSERLQYLDGQIGNFEYYVKRAQRAEGSGLCALVEPRYLVPPRRRKWLFHNP